MDRDGLASSTRSAAKRKSWKGVVANSSVMTQRQSKVMEYTKLDIRLAAFRFFKYFFVVCLL